jgi:hypothetical protein
MKTISGFIYLFKVLMRPRLLKQAIMAVEWENAELLDLLSEYEMEETQTNLTWSEGDMWYGWIFNPERNRYYFNDIGNESISGLWEDQRLMELNSPI